MRLGNGARCSGCAMAIAAAMIASHGSAQQPAIHVDGSLQTNGDGVSWSTAFNSLDAAFGPAQSSGLPIWVKAGVYRPHPSDRSVSFTIEAPIVIYGGFEGNESVLEERDVEANPTYLDGDIDFLTFPDGPDFADRDGNSYHVVRVVATDDEETWGSEDVAVLDGLIIRGGNADGSGFDRIGGGVLVRDLSSIPSSRIWLLLQSTRLTDNSADSAGGGLAAYDSSVEFRDCVIDGNRVLGETSLTTPRIVGGAGFHASHVRATRTLIEENRAVASPGGGAAVTIVLFEPAVSTFVNVRFIENRAGETGGGLDLDVGDAELANCLFARNHAEADGSSPSGIAGAGGGLATGGGNELVVVNCTFADNTAVNDLFDTGFPPTFDDGHGAGVYRHSGSTLTIRNTVLWGNRVVVGAPGSPVEVGHHGAQLNIVASGSLSASPLAYTNIENNAGCGSSCSDPAPDGWFNIGHVALKHDPLFVDPPSNNYLHRSPAMAMAGSNADLPDDVNDVDDNGIVNEVLPLSLVLGPRVLDYPTVSPQPGIVDMGAYEWCIGDLTGDGLVDGADLGDLLNHWGACPSNDTCPWDLDQDGMVNGADLGILLNNWDCTSTAPAESMLLSGGEWMGDYLADLLETYGFEELWELLEWLDELEPWERALVFADLLH